MNDILILIIISSLGGNDTSTSDFNLLKKNGCNKYGVLDNKSLFCL